MLSYIHLFATHIEVELEHLYIPFLVHLLVVLIMEWETGMRCDWEYHACPAPIAVVVLVAKMTFSDLAE